MVDILPPSARDRRPIDMRPGAPFRSSCSMIECSLLGATLRRSAEGGQPALEVTAHQTFRADEHGHYPEHPHRLPIERPGDTRSVTIRGESELIEIARDEWPRPVGLHAHR